MFGLIVGLSLALSINALWTKVPPLKIHSVNIEDSEYSISTKEVQHIRYKQTYDVQLQVKNKDAVNYTHVGAKELLHKGCIFDQRRINLDFSREISMPTTNLHYFTHIVPVSAADKAYLIRTDCKIYELNSRYGVGGELTDLQLNPNPVDFSSKLPATTLLLNPQVVSDESYAYVFTEVGAVYFYTRTSSLSESFEVTSLKTQTRHHIYKVHRSLFLNLVFVVAGEEGIDVYSLVDFQLTFLYTIVIEGKDGKPLKLIDARLSLNNTELFVLDDREGIHFVSIAEKTMKIIDFQIAVSNPSAFASYDGSLVVVAKTSQDISYAIEILVDFTTRQYYYNKFYLEDMQLRDVIQLHDKDLAMLIGYDVHKAIFMGIFQGFTDNEFDYDLEFIEPDLQQIAVIEKLHQATTKTYMLALSKDQVRSYQLTEHAPALMCESPVNLYQQYIVKANKTACVEKTSSSPFELCQTEHRFTLDVSDALIESDQKSIAFVAIGVTVFILLLIVLVSWLCCRRWKLTLQTLRETHTRMQQKKRYMDIPEQFSPGGSDRQA